VPSKAQLKRSLVDTILVTATIASTDGRYEDPEPNNLHAVAGMADTNYTSARCLIDDRA
jgi:hypothetical protein